MDNLSLLSSYPDNDNDSISDDSRKIRKQRNTYQKIPDDIRVQLLECVQNGETLKAAAKRFKVNYSSAKSILHTYRKEGRILKKAAQERCVKKRDNSVEDDDIVPATKPSTKKETAKAVADESEIPHVAAERTVSVSTCATLSDENRPTVSNIVQNEDIVGAGKMDQSQECDKALNQRPIMNLISQDHGPHGYMTRRKRSIQLLDSFFSQPDFHFPEHGGVDTGNNVTGNQYHTDEYSSFNDMMSAFHRKASYSGDLFNDYTGFLGTKVLTPVNGQENNKTFKFDHSENLGHYHFKSFLDTQNLLREAFRKGSVSRFRKNSFDMF